MLTWQDIEDAKRRLAGVAHRTPVLHSRQFDDESGATVYFKAENLQRGGAFKFRGAYNKIKAETERRKVPAVVAFSSGNHAQAVALVSRLLGIRATVVMPLDAPQTKIDATRGYGAEVVLYDRATQSRDDLADEICRERGAVLVPPFDDELIMAGQATGAVELLEEVPDLDAVVVPVSGGGLLGGWATAARKLRPGIAIYGAEPESAADTKQSLDAGQRVEVAENPTIADGLRVTSPGKLTFPIVQEMVKDILLVSDAEMVETLTWMLERMKVLVEPSGAAAAAAVRHRKADFAGQRVGVVLSGGNVDLARLAEYIASRRSL
ncbi:MAG TPA: pyridoxal-phosphate dependent enzyme [Thermoanaerobaculia bacterium]|jgi:threonine dehydratase|nr:pyridoxal-phosphate dependent enzyme [Thermoanaerobaculia bacterium]